MRGYIAEEAIYWIFIFRRKCEKKTPLGGMGAMEERGLRMINMRTNIGGIWRKKPSGDSWIRLCAGVIENIAISKEAVVPAQIQGL